MEFQVGKYNIEVTINSIQGGFIFGGEIDYWSGLLSAKIEVFSHVISFSIEKVPEEANSIGYLSNGR